MSKLVHMSSFFCTKCSQQGEQGRQEAGSVQEVYLRWVRGKDVLAAGEQEESGPGHKPLGGSWFSQGVCGHSGPPNGSDGCTHSPTLGSWFLVSAVGGQCGGPASSFLALTNL